MFRIKKSYESQSDYKKYMLSQSLHNFIIYAINCNTETIYNNVYQTLLSYRSAYIIVYEDEYVVIVQRYIDELKIAAKRDGVKLW